MVFSVTAADGHVLVYDLHENQHSPVEVLEANNKGASVYCAANTAQRCVHPHHPAHTNTQPPIHPPTHTPMDCTRV